VDKRFPVVSKELLLELEKRFIDRLPDGSNIELNEVLFKSGQVSVIRLLRSAYEAQTKNVLENR
jgi:hypothetical protein